MSKVCSGEQTFAQLRTGLRKKLYTNACDKNKTKRKKERTDYKCLWQRKKDQTTNVDGKQKMAALIRQANS